MVPSVIFHSCFLPVFWSPRCFVGNERSIGRWCSRRPPCYYTRRPVSGIWPISYTEGYCACIKLYAPIIRPVSSPFALRACAQPYTARPCCLGDAGSSIFFDSIDFGGLLFSIHLLHPHAKRVFLCWDPVFTRKFDDDGPMSPKSGWSRWNFGKVTTLSLIPPHFLAHRDSFWKGCCSRGDRMCGPMSSHLHLEWFTTENYEIWSIVARHSCQSQKVLLHYVPVQTYIRKGPSILESPWSLSTPAKVRSSFFLLRPGLRETHPIIGAFNQQSTFLLGKTVHLPN